MSQTLKINNFSSLNILETTNLAAEALTGVTSLTVENNQGFTTNNKFLLGTLGAENTELVTVASTTAGTGITVSVATKHDHGRGTDVTKLYGTQAKIYRALNSNGSQPADDAFASIATIDLDVDQSATEYTDSSGDSTYWYKFTYYDGTTETPLADSSAARGGNVGNYCTLDDIREEAGFTNAKFITDAMIESYRQSAQAEINGALVGIYTLPFAAPINPFIRDITKRLAAARLLLNQYGAYGTPDSNKGIQLLNSVTNGQGTGDLDKLKSKQSTLTDVSGADTALSTSDSFMAWPNASTATTDSELGGSERNFRMGDVQGFRERKY